MSRKDLAQVLEVSSDSVRRNEKRWGLDTARIDYNQRLIRYKRTEAEASLTEKGLI